MKKKTKKALYFIFWAATFLTFVTILAWYISEPYLKPPLESDLTEKNPQEWITVVEEKEPTPEEKRPLPEISEDELAFKARAKAVLQDFPKKEILQQEGRDHHKPPPELVGASEELGAIEDLLDKNPKLLREGLKFYKQCALEESILTSLRALCLHNLKSRAKSAGIERRIRWRLFPEHLHRLADKLN